MLLFEKKKKKIWNVSSDSLALKTYFDAQKDLYNEKDLESIKGKVMNDFQTTLDNEWIQLLRAKSKFFSYNEKI